MAKAKRSRTDGGKPGADLSRRAVDSAMRLAASKGWGNVTLAGVAADCGVELRELYLHYPSRVALLAGFARRIDAEVLQGGTVDKGAGSARDRLFEAMMRRYEALKPFREAISSISAAAPRDPLAMLCLAPQLRRSMAWTLEAAGISSAGPCGLLKAKGLALVHVAVMRTWFKDDSRDLSKTMAALDRALKCVEPIAGTLFNGRFPGRRAKSPKE